MLLVIGMFAKIYLSDDPRAYSLNKPRPPWREKENRLTKFSPKIQKKNWRMSEVASTAVTPKKLPFEDLGDEKDLLDNY